MTLPNTNLGVPDHLPVTFENLDAFDNLPAVAREALTQANLKWSAKSMAEAIERFGLEGAIQVLKWNDQEQAPEWQKGWGPLAPKRRPKNAS